MTESSSKEDAFLRIGERLEEYRKDLPDDDQETWAAYDREEPRWAVRTFLRVFHHSLERVMGYVDPQDRAGEPLEWEEDRSLSVPLWYVVDWSFKGDRPLFMTEGAPRKHWRGRLITEREFFLLSALSGGDRFVKRGHSVEPVRVATKDGFAYGWPFDRENPQSSGMLMIRFGPLVVDEDERHAYFAVIPSLELHKGIDLDPWTEEERDRFWQRFSKAFDFEEVLKEQKEKPSPVVVAPGPFPPEIMGRIPVPRGIAKSTQAYALVRGLGRMFAGYSKVTDLDLRGAVATDEAESLFWAGLEDTLGKLLEPDKWKLDRNGQAVLSLRGMNEEDARETWGQAVRSMNAGKGGPGLEVVSPAFEDRARFESGNVVKETRLVFWPEDSLRDRAGEECPPVRFRRESSPGYVALLERHGPRPYFADGWYWVPRGNEREGFRIGGLPMLLFPEGRSALERLAKRDAGNKEEELQRIFREPSLFRDDDERASRDLRDAIRRTKARLQRLSVYDVGQDLVLCIFEAFHRQRNAWINQRVILPDAREIETNPWRIIRLDPDGLAVRLDLKRKWRKDWRHRLFDKLEALTTLERQTRTRTGRKVDVGDRFLLRVIDGRRGVEEGAAPETDSGLGLTRLLRHRRAFPLDAFFVEVSVDFMERLVTWVVDKKGTVHWGLNAARAAERAAITTTDAADKKEAREEARAKLQDVRERPHYDHSPRLLTLGNVLDWPLERRTLAYVFLQEETPNFERYRDHKGQTRTRPKPNRLGGKRKLVSIGGRDFVACNGSRGHGYKVRTWINKADYEKRTGPGGGVLAFASFVRDLEGFSSALELHLEVVLPGRGTKTNGEALQALKVYTDNPPAAYGFILKAYLPADLEGRLEEHLREARGIETVDEAEPIDPLHKASRMGGLTPADLRTARKRAGWSQGELAGRVRVSQKLVSLWETGAKPISADREGYLRKLLSEQLP